MHLDLAQAVFRYESYALPAGVALQVLACLMNHDNRFVVLQAGLGLLGVALMVIGFDRMSG